MKKIVAAVFVNFLVTAGLTSHYIGSRVHEKRNPAARSEEVDSLAAHVLALEKQLAAQAEGEKKFREEMRKSYLSSFLEAILARRDVSIVGSEFKEAAQAEAESLTRKGEAEVWVPLSASAVRRQSDGFEVTTKVPLSTSGVYAKALREKKRVRFGKLPKPVGGVAAADMVSITPID